MIVVDPEWAQIAQSHRCTSRYVEQRCSQWNLLSHAGAILGDEIARLIG